MKTRGWRNVFAFTFIQHIKTKSFIVGTIVMCVITALICVLTNILPVMINKSSDDAVDIVGTGDNVEAVDSFLDYGTVYLFDDAGILAANDKEMLAGTFSNGFSEPEKSLGDLTAEMKSAERSEIAVQIISQSGKDGTVTGYEVRSYYTSASKDSADLVGNIMTELVNRRILLNAGVAPEKYAETQVSVFATKSEAGGKNLNSVQGFVNYVIPLLVSLVLFMLIFTYGSMVANSIATEKTSRVMELLLTSVRPLAVVIGKVLAMAVVSFSQFTLIILVGWGSFAASMPFGWIKQTTDLLKDPEIQSALAQAGQLGAPAGVSSSDLEIAQALNDLTKALTPLNIVLIIVVFLLGFLFYSLIAALIGASVSRMEDLSAAMGPYSITGLLGMYLAYLPVIFSADSLASGDASINPVQMFSYFFPLSSPFSLPAAILLGSLELWQSLAAVALLAVCVVLIAMVVGKVYEAIILHNGNRIKFGDIIKMAVRK